jgi:hypothetical protein
VAGTLDRPIHATALQLTGRGKTWHTGFHSHNKSLPQQVSSTQAPPLTVASSGLHLPTPTPLRPCPQVSELHAAMAALHAELSAANREGTAATEARDKLSRDLARAEARGDKAAQAAAAAEGR